MISSVRRALTVISVLIAPTETNGELKMEGRNERALAVYSRVQKKLTGENSKALVEVYSRSMTGRDFNPDVELSVNAQVEMLILQATAVENLCQCFLGMSFFDGLGRVLTIFRMVCILVMYIFVLFTQM